MMITDARYDKRKHFFYQKIFFRNDGAGLLNQKALECMSFLFSILVFCSTQAMVWTSQKHFQFAYSK